MKYILFAFFFITGHLLCAQIKSNTQLNISITFGHAPDCYGNSGICTFQIMKNKKIYINNIMQFNIYKNELKLVLNKMSLTNKNINKLLNDKLTKGFYRYVINENFVLSKEIKKELNIDEFTIIKKGVYLVRVRDNQIIMKLKLE